MRIKRARDFCGRARPRTFSHRRVSTTYDLHPQRSAPGPGVRRTIPPARSSEAPRPGDDVRAVCRALAVGRCLFFVTRAGTAALARPKVKFIAKEPLTRGSIIGSSAHDCLTMVAMASSSLDAPMVGSRAPCLVGMSYRTRTRVCARRQLGVS